MRASFFFPLVGRMRSRKSRRRARRRTLSFFLMSEGFAGKGGRFQGSPADQGRAGLGTRRCEVLCNISAAALSVCVCVAVQAGTEVEPTILNNIDGEGQNDEVQGEKPMSQPSDAKARNQRSFVHHRTSVHTCENKLLQRNRTDPELQKLHISSRGW